MGACPPSGLGRAGDALKHSEVAEMRINCVSCGHQIDLADAYDDYDGQVKCWVCDALLHIRTEQGAVKAMRLAADESPLGVDRFHDPAPRSEVYHTQG